MREESIGDGGRRALVMGRRALVMRGRALVMREVSISDEGGEHW